MCERQKQIFSLEEYMMINDCMKDKPSFVKRSKRLVRRRKKRERWKLSICASAGNICAHVFTLTLVRFSNKTSNVLRLDGVNRLKILFMIQRCCKINMKERKNHVLCNVKQHKRSLDIRFCVSWVWPHVGGELGCMFSVYAWQLWIHLCFYVYIYTL